MSGPVPSPANVLLLDNRDSFVYNLLDEFASAGMHVDVYRSDVPAADLLQRLECYEWACQPTEWRWLLQQPFQLAPTAHPSTT